MMFRRYIITAYSLKKMMKTDFLKKTAVGKFLVGSRFLLTHHIVARLPGFSSAIFPSLQSGHSLASNDSMSSFIAL